MPARDLPARPNVEQYKKQAKSCWPRGKQPIPPHWHVSRHTVVHRKVTLADAQFVIAREHGCDSWPKFSRHVERLLFARELASITESGRCIHRRCLRSKGRTQLRHAETGGVDLTAVPRG